MSRHRATLLAGTALAFMPGLAAADPLEEATPEDPIEIVMYYPIAVGGPLESVIDEMVAGFMEEYPQISVQAVYSGNYDETMVQVQSAIDAGDPPATTVLSASQMYVLAAEGMILPFDDVIEGEADRDWLDGFYEGFLANSRDGDGRTWGIPFQRSTTVQFWNKEAFEAAGLDPDHAPQDWDELREIAAAVQEGSDVEWGVQMPSSIATAFWLTGNLSNIRANADFEFGVDMLLAGVQRGSPTGGGNFYLIADASPDEQRAAMKLIRYMTAPEQLAQWTIDTGYVAPRPDAWETDTLRDHVADFPAAAVARDQLDYAVRELSTYARGQVYEVFNDAIQSALVGDAAPAGALSEAQAEAETILAPYR